MHKRESHTQSASKKPSTSFLSKSEEQHFFGAQAKTADPFFSPSFIQPKLEIGQPNDEYEQEADRVANAVMRMPDIQRMCPRCQERAKQGKPLNCSDCEKELQMKPDIQFKGNGKRVVDPAIASQLQTSKGSGNPLPSNAQMKLGSKMDADFSGVNIHTDSKATQMNRQLGAKAFTYGNDIYFNKGQYNLESSQGKHLIAHELTHVVQQKHASSLLQRTPKTETDVSVESCLTQKDGDLLPRKVGVVEHINREVMLNEILGKERKKLEDQIRHDYDARKFVCEAGISAMLALYYNRDYHNRLSVKRARQSFSKHPEYYSLLGINAIKQTKKMLKKKYNIFIESGDKDWSPEDIGLLAEALGKLTEKEIPLISNYHFIRWTNECNQLRAKNPYYECKFPEDYNQCGLHEVDIVDRKYTISIYDCMKDRAKPEYNVKPGADTIIHEIGHAMEFGRLRLALEKTTDAKKAYKRLKSQYDAATTAKQKMSIHKKLVAAKKDKDNADKELNKILSASVLDEFKKFIKGKKALTPYAATNIKEAFAEAFMLFKVSPAKLKKLNRPLFNWFSKGGFI